MTNINPHAQVRIGFYQARFQSETNDQLVKNFNSLADSRGWTAERSFYTEALMNELQRRNIDLSVVVETNSEGKILSVKNRHVRYDESQHALILID